MAKLTFALTATLAAFASAFVPSSITSRSTTTSLEAVKVEEGAWDPLQLSILGKNVDTFPNMFPDQQFVKEAEIKHGRMSMLAWSGIWATHVGGLGLGMHIPGMPVEPDWTKAFDVLSQEQPALVASVIVFIAIAEGESVGHSGDNFRGKGTKVPGDFGLDPVGMKTKLSAEEYERYTQVEMTQGRAAMLGMASMFAFESIPGSVPFMDVLGAQ